MTEKQINEKLIIVLEEKIQLLEEQKVISQKIIDIQNEQLILSSVVKSLKAKELPSFEEWKQANYIHYDKNLFVRKQEGLKDLDQLIKKYDAEIKNL